MAKTLLQLVQAASAEMNLTIPTQVVGNTDTQVQQLLYLTNAIGDELQQEFDWEQLNKAYRFYVQYLTTTGDIVDGSPIVTNIPSTSGLSDQWMVASADGIPQDTYIVSVDSATQVTLNQPAQETTVGVTLNFGQTIYDLPTDWSRQINRTHYDKSKRWEMLGPETAQQWEFLKSSYISTGPRMRYRIMGGYFQIWPITTTNEYLGYEYVSSYWARDTNGAEIPQFVADTDTCIYPDRLMIEGIKARFFSVKGFNNAEFAAKYNTLLSNAKAMNAGAPTLAMAPKISTVLIGYENIPDGTIYGQGG